MVELAHSEDSLRACYPVMAQLRPGLDCDTFLEKVLLQTVAGYRIACLKAADEVVAVAGFRISHSLAWGKYLYIDDLITDKDQRSKGYGKQLLDWLTDYAREKDCETLHLDSGIQRKHAHRFYEREGLALTSYHYGLKL